MNCVNKKDILAILPVYYLTVNNTYVSLCEIGSNQVIKKHLQLFTPRTENKYLKKIMFKSENDNQFRKCSLNNKS